VVKPRAGWGCGKNFGRVGVPFFFFKHPLDLPCRDGVRSESGNVRRGVLLNASLCGLSCPCCVLLSVWGGTSLPVLNLFGNADAAVRPAREGWPQTNIEDKVLLAGDSN
jgi:hypothetical protein